MKEKWFVIFALLLFFCGSALKAAPEETVRNMYKALQKLDEKAYAACFIPEEEKIARLIIQHRRKQKMTEKGEVVIPRKKYMGNECEILTEKKGEFFSKQSFWLKKVQGKWRVMFVKTVKKGFSEPALKTACKGNLSQMMLALRMYEDRYNFLPPKGWQSLLEKKFVYHAKFFHCPASGREFIYTKVPLDKDQTVKLKIVAYCPFHKDPETGKFLHVLFSSREIKSAKITPCPAKK